MKLPDLTDSHKISKIVLPSMLEDRTPYLLREVQMELNARIENGDLTGHENGAAFIAAVRDAVLVMPGLDSRPTDGQALNLAVQLIDTMFKYERIAQADAQIGA